MGHCNVTLSLICGVFNDCMKYVDLKHLSVIGVWETIDSILGVWETIDSILGMWEIIDSILGVWKIIDYMLGMWAIIDCIFSPNHHIDVKMLCH